MKISTEDIKKISAYFKNKPVERAFLFGSQVKGTVHEESDIDLLVELDYSKKIGLEFIKMQQELEEILGSKVDLVSSQALSKHLKPIVDREKLLLYER